MPGWNDENGHQVVRFGESESDVMPLEKASELLMEWRKAEPERFGYWLARAYTGVAPSNTKRGGARV
jgi:hypothetical protein